MAEAPYRELVIDGPKDWLPGFVKGFVTARGMAGAVIDAELEGCDVKSWRERVLERFTPKSEIHHLVVRADALQAAREAIEAAATAGRSVEIREERAITRASIAFEFDVYSKSHARAIRERLDSLPMGVALSDDTSLEERSDPTAKGLEAYAPAHDYAFVGRGTVEGDVRGVIEVARWMRDNDLIDASETVLHASDG